MSVTGMEPQACLCSTDFAQLDWARVTRGWISISFWTGYEVL